jgi:hypothetical protein
MKIINISLSVCLCVSFLFIVIKPSDINKKSMVQLAKRLKAEFCLYERAQFVIFDNKKYADVTSMNDYIQSKGKTILMRGYYSFNRITGEDLLEFSTKRGNPTTENQIDLSKIMITIKSGKL